MKFNESALDGLPAEDADRIRQRAHDDIEAKNLERYGPMPDPSVDPNGWKWRMFKRMYRALEFTIAAHSAPGRIENTAVKTHWNRLFAARPDLVGADFETIREAFKVEYLAWKTDQNNAGNDERVKAAAYLAGLAEKSNPLNAPRQKRIEGTPVTRRIGEIMNSMLQKPSQESDELAAAFPRDAEGNPLPEPPDDNPLPPPPPPPPSRWQDDEEKMAAFRKAVRSEIDHAYGEGAVSPQGVNEIVQAALNGSVDAWQGTGSDALAKIKAYIKAQNANAEAPNLNENGASRSVAPVTPETPRQEPSVKQYEASSTAMASRIPALPETAAWLVQVHQAEIFLKSGLLPPSIRSVEQVITIAEMGKVLGVPPMVAINNINVIQGRPTVAPQLMLALIRRSGQLADLKIEDDGNACTVTMTRKGETPHTEKFSMADAAAMGLAGKDNWRKQPAVMRKWRAISAACRVVFPDVIWGFYTPEEME